MENASNPRLRPAGNFRSIRTKISLLVALAIGAAVLASTVLALAHTTHMVVSSERSILVSTARVFAAAVTKGVVEKDEAAIYNALIGMRAFEGTAADRIDYVGVEDLNGRALADLGAAPRLLSDASVGRGEAPSFWTVVTSHTLEAVEPVGLPGHEPIGRIVIIKQITGLMDALRQTLLVSVAAGVAAMALGLLAAARLERAITRPVVDLAATMARVRVGNDFHVEADVSSNDEVGELVTSFNTMIAGIRERDDKLAEHRENLEHQVADRTRDLHLAKLAAENANAAKSDFLATMSHEIRTPMNGMLVMAELLTAGELPTRQRRYAEVIARSGQSLLAIINDILDFSKVEAGKMDIEHIPVDPTETADTVLSLFWERAQKKGLDLAAHVAPDVPRHIMSDPVRLNQVIGNLVNNALKFTEKGHVLVSIGRDPHDPSRLRFAVTDTGIGIPEHKVDKLFSAFAQVDQTTTRKFGGTGLGLAICKRLVEAMGGSFRVTSEIDRGSTFAFSIPIPGADEARPVARVQPIASRLPTAIVAVRGDATARVAADHFAACGYGVERRDPDDIARTGLPACDLLFMEGSVLAQSSGARPARVIALTTMGDGSERQLAAGSRADAVLVRPLAQAELDGLGARLAAGLDLAGFHGERRARQDSLPRFTGRRVLVADDSAVNREVAVEALSRLGASADVAADGREAVEAARRGGYDLILMDGSMPELDGFEAARFIRDEEARRGAPRLPIVALTAHVVGSAADLWKTAGMDGILHKPFTIASMADCLAPYLSVGNEPVDAPKEPTFVEASTETAPEPDGLLDMDTFGQLEMMAEADGGVFLARVVGLYLEHAPKTLVQLEEALAGDPEDQAKAAHALKSMSYNIGAIQVAKAAGACEAQVREHGKALVQADADRLRALVDATAIALRGKLPPQATAAA
ncbi:hypothetical protein GCM10007036_38340 [Alsobacter metallidurans]|uniref:histidine kinase n=1 Tax=Alsobacter metallidurans TaxID=340221 RepID=A0A917I9V6_9HYPH|nr:ATP-binding protein [Alsobacter metallidurans]GGH28847.1 hypothetical protein GCM10007036_38340 [Alsobacter metallidurans]